MQKIYISILLMMGAVCIYAQGNPVYLDYIARWQEVAVANQRDYGIPASIILAQGLLESAAGTSELAQKANNHFGIKCASDWQGETYRYDDDRRNECFRVYDNAYESFRDHSLFLQRSRYQPCFEIVPEDYAGWAHQLKRCGYATDPRYPQKLIRLIEEYRLDTIASPQALASARADGYQPPKAIVVSQSEPIATFASNPEPPFVEPLSAYKEKKLFFLRHPKQRQNGVRYVVAQEGDTYATIAFSLNMRERQLREWNDALGRDLQVGDYVYLARKKCYGSKKRPIIWVHPGEALWTICQREGVRMDKVQKINGLDKSVRVFSTRQQILLRKPKK